MQARVPDSGRSDQLLSNRRRKAALCDEAQDDRLQPVYEPLDRDQARPTLQEDSLLHNSVQLQRAILLAGIHGARKHPETQERHQVDE